MRKLHPETKQKLKIIGMILAVFTLWNHMVKGFSSTSDYIVLGPLNNFRLWVGSWVGGLDKICPAEIHGACYTFTKYLLAILGLD